MMMNIQEYVSLSIKQTKPNYFKIYDTLQTSLKETELQIFFYPYVHFAVLHLGFNDVDSALILIAPGHCFLYFLKLYV